MFIKGALVVFWGRVLVWLAVGLLRPRSYAFRLGRGGLWVDGDYYHWHRILAVTHYNDLHTLLIKVERTGAVPLALTVDLRNTRFRRTSANQLRKEFQKHVDQLIWKSV